ncbi:MAG TPA: prolipoprotein diacylglyceryl transferase family protein, partial [Arthrobacter sp.]|nr:prolipoprotein diacylglyceryl transferase family protein [Arthrobacter sp.]
SLIPQIQRGGLGIWGAVVLGAVGAWIGCRRAGVKLSAFVDAAAPGLLLAQAIGRWGNYFNQELFGGPTTLPWGLQVDANSPNFPAGMPADTLFHPTFLYESLWNLVGVGILLLLDRRFSFRRSRLFWLYAIYYTLGRVWIEAMRIDDAEQISLFGITTRLNVWTSLIVLVAALLAFILLGLRKGTQQDSPYLRGREPAVVEGVDTADEDGTARGESSEAADGEAGDASDEATDKTTDEATTGDAGDRAHDAEKATVPAVRHSDSAVSDSESRDNLRENQSGPDRASAPAVAAGESSGGGDSAAGQPAAGRTGRRAAGTAPETDAIK